MVEPELVAVVDKLEAAGHFRTKAAKALLGVALVGIPLVVNSLTLVADTFAAGFRRPAPAADTLGCSWRTGTFAAVGIQVVTDIPRVDNHH